MRTVLITLAILAPASPLAAQDEVPRYLAAMNEELTAMELNAGCEATTPQRAHCSFTRRGTRSAQDFAVHVVYSDETDSVYAYVDRYLSAPPEAPATPVVLMRLMELNWTMLAGKFEWDSSDGEVRLAVFLHTDSNFDRRAFRSLVRSLLLLADRYHGELTALLRQPAAPPSSP